MSRITILCVFVAAFCIISSTASFSDPLFKGEMIDNGTWYPFVVNPSGKVVFQSPVPPICLPYTPRNVTTVKDLWTWQFDIVKHGCGIVVFNTIGKTMWAV